jgi:hypothetical protein
VDDSGLFGGLYQAWTGYAGCPGEYAARNVEVHKAGTGAVSDRKLGWGQLGSFLEE